MAYYEDLSPYSYLPHPSAAEATNVGWLDNKHTFSTCSPSNELLDAVWAFCEISVAQTRGFHICEICGDNSRLLACRGGESRSLGSAEIRVFSSDGRIFAAPNLIYHYIDAHRYCPPVDFRKAALCSARPPSPEYFAALKGCGMKWNRASPAPDKLPRRRISDDRLKEGGIR